jgi:hypothetical protein
MIQSRCAVHTDLGGGKFQATIGLRPIQINKGAGWTDIVNDFVTGDANFPLVVTNAPMLIYWAAGTPPGA